MKRILLAIAVLAFVFPAVRQAEAADISIDFFYDNIGDGGNWVEVADYGYCWQPSVAASNRSWRPYTDGYWAYTDVGWTWVSYEDFGWATYHYGRWVRLRGRGWIWVPGREWGPAWVSWRTGGDYVGWAPLPPHGGGDFFYENRAITARVDIEFDIGPLYYNFIDVRYIGEPVLRERIFASEQNVTYITKTVNVTNIIYRDNQVHNYGPDYNTLSRYSTRPIQRLSLQRETSADPLTAVRSKSVMKVEGDKLVVASPQTLQKPSRSIAPKVVKEKIAQTPLERGWEGVSDQKAQAELKQKIKSEDPKTVSPPTVQPVRESAASPAPSAPATSAASATPATGVSPAATAPAASASPAVSASVSPAKGKDKDKDKGKKSDFSPAPSVAATATPAATAAMTPAKDKTKKDEKVSPKETPATTPAASLAPAITPDTRDKGKDKQREKAAPSASVPPSSAVTATGPPTPADTNKADKRKPKDKPPVPPVDTMERTPLPVQPQSDRKRDRIEPVKPDAAPEKPKQEKAVEPSSKPPKKEQAAPPAPAANAPANPPPRDEGKKQKKNEPAASPTP
ncbi:MAG TPA: DUF6600 domain-containing protein [Chthoniobacterales bacterium]|nr:DUF6600 domain-containing protein [Chthoniobacterales bacterium]